MHRSECDTPNVFSALLGANGTSILWKILDRRVPELFCAVLCATVYDHKQKIMSI